MTEKAPPEGVMRIVNVTDEDAATVAGGWTDTTAVQPDWPERLTAGDPVRFSVPLPWLETE